MITCDFCGKDHTQVKQTFQGRPSIHIHICNECVELCTEILIKLKIAVHVDVSEQELAEYVCLKEGNKGANNEIR